MIASFLSCMLFCAAAAEGPDTIVVCPAELRPALRPWLEYRAAQGHRVAVLANAESAAVVHRQIHEAAASGTVRQIVLVGDTPPLGSPPDATWPADVPVHYCKAKVNVRWGSEPTIATDLPYADLDDDGVPDVALGRLTADSPEELQRTIAKIIAYEQSTDMGPWRRQIDCIAGVGGLGLLADTIVESAAKFFITQSIPAAYRVSMTYGNWRSPFCPDPRLFRQTTLERLNEGSWFWVYLGHGHHLSLDRLDMPGGPYPIFNINDVPKLRCQHAAPIALFLACYTGAIDAPQECLAEEMLRQPGGPVAILAGTRVTMPYGMGVMACAMMDVLFFEQPPTVGEVVLRAKRRMLATAQPTDQKRVMLDALAAAVEPGQQYLADERQEHASMFNLLGDPLLQLKYPKTVRLEAPPEAIAGATFRLQGACPIDGTARIELCVRRDRPGSPVATRREFAQTSEELATYQQAYQKANDPCLAAIEARVSAGRFAADLQVPSQAAGPHQICVFVEGARDFAMGSAEVKIQKPPAQ